MSKRYKSTAKAFKKAGRRISAGLLTAAAAAAVIPFRIERQENKLTGDDDVVFTSLLLRASYTPKHEDSENAKPSFSVALRPAKDVKKTVSHVAELTRKPTVEPAALPEDGLFDDDKKILKETVKVRALEEKAKKHRVKIAKRRRKLAKQQLKRAKRVARRKPV